MGVMEKENNGGETAPQRCWWHLRWTTPVLIETGVSMSVLRFMLVLCEWWRRRYWCFY